MMEPLVSPGSEVVLVVPENRALHGRRAVVVSVTDWGAHVLTGAAATGNFRALFSEMVFPNGYPTAARAVPGPGGSGEGKSLLLPLPSSGTAEHPWEYSGSCCDVCGSARLRRAGPCLVCEDCGTSGGCG